MGTFELDRHFDVLGFGGQVCHRESERIGTEFFDHVQRIDPIPLALGHRFAISVENLGVDEDVVKGDLVQVVQAGQHHSGDPQGDDIAAGDQYRRRVEVLQFRRCLGPP